MVSPTLGPDSLKFVRHVPVTHVLVVGTVIARRPNIVWRSGFAAVFRCGHACSLSAGRFRVGADCACRTGIPVQGGVASHCINDLRIAAGIWHRRSRAEDFSLSHAETQGAPEDSGPRGIRRRRGPHTSCGPADTHGPSAMRVRVPCVVRRSTRASRRRSCVPRASSGCPSPEPAGAHGSAHP